ncbi:MAG: LysR family transcriptional regulator [Deltaproteobacteria bacterium]|nr:LysR family transcriptional regulator [Deltaproteobacteria bacterium]
MERLEAFKAVVRHGGFERATESIHLSQPAISKRIKELEKQLGVELFGRVGRKGHLTDAGRIVEEYASRLMIVVGEMNQAIDELKGLQRGQLRCGATKTIAVHLLPKILVQFKRAFPNIELRLLVGRNADIEKMILANEVDIGLVPGTITNPANLRIFHFLTDEFVLTTPCDHPLAKLHRVSLKQLENFPLILREKGSFTRRIIDESFREAGIPHRCMMQIETTEALKKAVAEGLGCSIISLCSTQTERKAGILAYARISGTPMKREFRAIIHKDKSLSGPIKPFLDLLGIKINS